MEREITEVYCGNGKGKTTLAVGRGLRFATQGKSVIIIQFLKGRERIELDFLEELDNFDFKIFRFEKMDTCYNDPVSYTHLDVYKRQFRDHRWQG